MSYISLSHQSFLTLCIAFFIAIILALSLRALVRKRSNNSLSNELAQKDNYAMGISYAAQLFTTLIVTGFIVKNIHFEKIEQTLIYPLILLGAAFLLIQIGSRVHARIILNRFNEDKAILEKNVCAAIVESSALVANGILVVGLYKWSQPNNLLEVIVLAIAFICCQFLMVMQSRWHEYWFAKANQGEPLQKSFVFNNTAIGLRYGSHTLASALAIYAGLSSITFHANSLVENASAILINCTILMLLQLSLSALLTRIALSRINAESEIDQQDNIGIASVDLAVNIGLALLLVRLFNV